MHTILRGNVQWREAISISSIDICTVLQQVEYRNVFLLLHGDMEHGLEGMRGRARARRAASHQQVWQPEGRRRRGSQDLLIAGNPCLTIAIAFLHAINHTDWWTDDDKREHASE